MPRKPAEPEGPRDIVRLSVRMERDERARIGVIAALLREDQETTVRRWLMERVAQEEKRLLRPPAKP